MRKLIVIIALMLIASTITVYEDRSYSSTLGFSGCVPFTYCDTLYNWETGERENKTINKIKIRTLRFFWELCDYQTTVLCSAGVNAETDNFHFYLQIGDNLHTFKAINNYPYN